MIYCLCGREADFFAKHAPYNIEDAFCKECVGKLEITGSVRPQLPGHYVTWVKPEIGDQWHPWSNHVEKWQAIAQVKRLDAVSAKVTYNGRTVFLMRCGYEVTLRPSWSALARHENKPLIPF